MFVNNIRKFSKMEILSEEDLACNQKRHIELSEDHPGFEDENYYQRRVMISELVSSNKFPMRFPQFEYTQREDETWSTIYTILVDMWPKYACEPFQRGLAILQSRNGFHKLISFETST